MPVLVMNLIVKYLDDVADGDDPDKLPAAQDGHLGDVAIGHLAHDRVDFILEMARHGVFRHNLREAKPAEAFPSIVDEAQDVAFAEDADQPATVVHDGQRTDVVLDELGNGLAHGRITVNGDDAASFRLQDISDQHGTSPRYGACELNQRVVIRPGDTLDLPSRNETRGYRDILSPFVQNFFLNSKVAGWIGIPLVLTFLIRAVCANQPIVENYVGRQIPTAMVARNLERGSGFLRPELDTAPFPNYFVVEAPLYQLVVVAARRATGLSLDASGRIVSALAMTLAACGLFELVRRRRGERAALLATLVFAIFPLTIRYGRAFQPDALMLGTVVAGLACWDRFESRSGFFWLVAGWCLLAFGFAVKIIAGFLLVPLYLTVFRRRRANDLAAAATTLLPALAWYAWASHLIRSGGGSHASADNQAVWLGLLGPAAPFKPETLVWVAWFLLIRAFTPIGAALAAFGLWNQKGERDRLFRVWGVSTLVVMAVLAEKLHHEYYWLLLAPVVAYGVGIALDQLGNPFCRIAALGGLALLCAIQVRSTWRMPADWDGLESAARTVAMIVPPEKWIAAPEALLYAADRRGCRMEWTAAAARRAAGEWEAGSRIGSPCSLLDYYRKRGARYFADLGNAHNDAQRMALHEFVRQRYKVIVDRPEVIVADLVNSEIRPHGN
jgi:hypothetical protein